MARIPKPYRLLIVIFVLLFGSIYIGTFHYEYVDKLSKQSINHINDIYKSKLGESDAANKNQQHSNENKENEPEQIPHPEESKDNVPNEIPPPLIRTEVPADYVRANATFVSLARNEDLWDLVDSIRHVEDRFNHKFKYDWVFINDKPFNDEFKEVTTALISGKTYYEHIPTDYWSFPPWIDQDRAALTREQMKEKKIIYGDSVSYRFMCRFESGFFWRTPKMNEYKYYWRVEPGIRLFCDVDYDVFKFMQEKKIRYGFTIAMYEFQATIETLWETTKKFLKAGDHKKYLAKDNLMSFLSNDNGESYNLCHFWSNFEIADMDFWRDEAYFKYFEYLDKSGGFFYERWGDAPIHSIAASLFLNKNEIHHFEDIGYFHNPYHHCPTTKKMRLERKCSCNPDNNFAWQGYSCTPQYYKAAKLTRPEGWSKQVQ